ncbi:glycosyltransferase family 31 protein [Calocera viscosa TUFC12733]|uniref:Hexosyltransferase n=1 Tax=Calocera viscosa (strain TUFC12733) TaxID=1330018 RepID=A0A167MJ47_CALVF|nr:glycosyltransferase family 31 protein [Calocera viscosa TUFC12733]
MAPPKICLSWAPSWLRNTSRAQRLILLALLALLLLLSSTFYVAHWRWRLKHSHHYPYRDHWLDVLPLTREVNITDMLASSPGQWDMFQELVPELLHAPLPQTHVCEDSARFGPILFVGVFSIAKEYEQRAVVRALQTLQSPPSEKVVMRFILGRSPNQKLQKLAENEAEMYGDIVFLDIEENMDDGKTYAYFKWVSGLPVGEQPRFVLKADSDTFLVLPAVLDTLSHLSCSQLVYWGTSWGSCLNTCYPFYQRGMAYGLSWPLVAWLGSANLPSWATIGMEDVRTGAWFGSLPREAGTLMVVDLYYHAGNWDGITIPWDRDTVALHSMKQPEHWARVASKLREIWEENGREWRWPPVRTLRERESEALWGATRDWQRGAVPART